LTLCNFFSPLEFKPYLFFAMTTTALEQDAPLRQIVDWRAALIAGLVAGAVFFAQLLWIAETTAGSYWLALRLLASALLGTDALTPASGDGARVVMAALAAHIPLSLGFACLIAFVLHRWGMIVGIAGGALFGLALYGVNFFALAPLAPQFALMKGSSLAFAHLIFGAFAGGVYELLEIERFAPINSAEETSSPN
jgi:hypothetical protein